MGFAFLAGMDTLKRSDMRHIHLTGVALACMVVCGCTESQEIVRPLLRDQVPLVLSSEDFLPEESDHYLEADFDGDGDLDYVVGVVEKVPPTEPEKEFPSSFTGMLFKLKLYRNVGTNKGYIAEAIEDISYSVLEEEMPAISLTKRNSNGDNRADFVVEIGESAGTLHVFENDPRGKLSYFGEYLKAKRVMRDVFCSTANVKDAGISVTITSPFTFADEDGKSIRSAGLYDADLGRITFSGTVPMGTIRVQSRVNRRSLELLFEQVTADESLSEIRLTIRIKGVGAGSSHFGALSGMVDDESIGGDGFRLACDVRARLLADLNLR